MLSALGAGGMGEVYRARDTKLNRDVAIKVLLPAVANDPDRLGRFSREAQVLASLNHPNIAAIYGLEEGPAEAASDGPAKAGRYIGANVASGFSRTIALVMELVEGEDLSQRIARGAIPLDEALPIARQIAEALEAAHELGIIHRDLKPANIKVRPDGTVKVLDFGLAKAVDPNAGSSVTAMNSPTFSIHATEAGLILGTAAYMSPEQAAGKAVDKRSDLWSFGVVLLEMLTGRHVFAGETVSHVLAAVLKDDPDWSSLPTTTPASINKLLQRCLQKDRRLRLDSAAAARLEIDDASKPGETVQRARPGWRWAAAVAVVSLIALMLFAARWWMPGDSVAVSGDVVRFAIHDTADVTVARVDARMALSPDGRTLAFVGYGERGRSIWLRALDSLASRPVRGTEGAAAITWYPDGRTLGFVVGGQIMKVSLPDGTPEQVGASLSTGIPTLEVGADRRFLVGDGVRFGTLPAAGGTPTWLPRVSAGDVHRMASFLPDGRHYLYSVLSTDSSRAGTFVADLDGGEPIRLLAVPALARYANGHLLFVRDQVLYAQPFNAAARQLSGEPVPLSENVVGSFTASNGGTVAYLPVGDAAESEAGQLRWLDRAGRLLGRIEQSTGAVSPAISPDGRHLAMQLRGDIWVFNLARGVLSRLTSGTTGLSLSAGSPTWLPDSRRVIFFRNAPVNGHDALIETEVGATNQEIILHESSGRHAHPSDLSADGNYLFYEGESADFDIWALRLTGDRQVRAYVNAPSEERQPAISPDGRWLAYTSDSSGRFEIYVQSFPDSGARIQVSPNGGRSARWRRDGTELYYLTPDGNLMAVPVRAGQPIEFGSPIALFRFVDPQQGPSGRPNYDVTADGQRFIVSSIERRTDPSLHVLLNWPAMLTAKAAR
ncbi:MAG: protein kinase [Acidobacteriota bacterium]|nr:protein kinase [Acidobacteriota bacterium]